MLLMSKDKFVATSRSKLVADVEALLLPMAAAAKRKPAPKPLSATKPAAKPAAKAAPIPTAKPISRSARLRQAESQVQAARPRDPRCVFRDMHTA